VKLLFPRLQGILTSRSFTGDKNTKPADITDAARSIPFMASNRLIIVRRTENISASALEGFIPYIDKPAESTCLIFVSSKTDFKKKFYKRIRSTGGAVSLNNSMTGRSCPG